MERTYTVNTDKSYSTVFAKPYTYPSPERKQTNKETNNNPPPLLIFKVISFK